MKVNAIAKDGNGYIWLGTDIGLYRFNGRTFVSITDSTNAPVTALTANGDTIWCGHDSGIICRYIRGKLDRQIFTGVQPKSKITSLTYRWGCLWTGTDAEGLFAFVNGEGYNLNMQGGLSDNYIYSITVTEKGQLLAATDRGLNIISMLSNGKPVISVLSTRNGFPDNIVRVVSVLNNGGNIVWAGLQDGGIIRTEINTNEASLIPFTKEWHWGQVNDILPLTSNHAWIATEEGYLIDCTVNADTSFDLRPYSFPGKRFRKLLQDESGNLWCATVEGLTMITDNYVSYLPINQHYSLSEITAMAFDRNNNLYFTQGSGLFKCALSSPEKIETVLRLKVPITCLYEDQKARLWIGTLGTGLWCYDKGSMKEIKSVSNLVNGQILDVSGLKDKLWVCSLNGVEEIAFDGALQPSAIIHHGKHTGIGSDYIYQLYPDNQGNMWMATDGAGICKFDGKQYRTWDSTDGFNSKVVYSITEDSRGQMWAASLGQGLFVQKGKVWEQIGKLHGLQDLNVSALSANRTGQVVIVHGKGIDEWYPTSRQFRHYNRRLNVDIDSQSNALNCFANDTAGNVWVPFEHGMISFHNLERAYDLRPSVAINEVSLFFKRLTDPITEFGPSENHIGFKFDGINFTNPERLYYRYKLEGYDTGWVTTNDESIPFPKLPSGKYNFRVQVALSNDFTGAKEASYKFRIAAPVWKRSWAITLAVILVILGAYGYMRLRVRTLRRSAMLQRERMMAEYEQLKNQVNPHFLFNSLNTLASLIEEDGEAAVQYTIQLSDLYRSMLAYKDRDLIYLSEEWDLLKRYVFVQQSRFRGGFRVNMDIPETILSSKQIVPLALQMLVENAIKHNIVSPAKPLVIAISADDSTLTIVNTINPKKSKEKGAGLGLANISRRYALMSNRSMEYGEKDNHFIVTLPLL